MKRQYFVLRPDQHPPALNVLGTQVLYSGAHDAIECDVAGSVPNFLYFMVWSRRYSSGDADVYGTYVDATGGMIANLVAFDVSTAQARRPQVAFGSQGYRYFVAWELSTSLLASRDVRAAATTLSGSPSVAGKSADIVVAATADDETEVDVSAEWDLVTPSVLVVHRKSTGIFGQRFDVPVNGIPTPSSGVVMLVPGANVGDAAVSQLGNGSVAMLVAYRFPGTFSDDIGVLLLDGSLNPIGATLTLGSNLLDESQPAIDGTMVTWSREESPLAGAKRDIICATFGMQSGALVVVTPPTVVAGASGVDEHGPTIARVGFRHCVAYVRNVGFLDDDIEAWLVNDDCTTCNSRIVLQGVGSGSYVREGAPSMASDWRHGFDGDRLLLAFTEADVAPPFSSQVVGQMIRGLAVGPSPVNLGGGCGFGGTASTDGASSVGNSLFELVLSGATPVGLHVLSLGMPGPGITCGACTLTDPLVLTIVGGAGSATSAFPIPCAASVAGAQFEAQWLTMFAAVDPCLLLPGVSSSNRLLVTIAN